jgi:HdeA/HdeB family
MKKIILLVLLVFSQISFSKDQSVPTFAFRDSSCGTWFKTKETYQETYWFWFRGFVSGYNYGNNDYYVYIDKLPNQETIFLYVDKYCRENPLNDFTIAMWKMIDELKRKR